MPFVRTLDDPRGQLSCCGVSTDEVPHTRRAPVTERLHEVDVVDPFRWLEGDNSDPERQGCVTDEVSAWTDAQNAYTRSVLDNVPGRAGIEASLRPLMEVGSVTAPAMRGDRYFFARREGNQNQAIVYVRQGYRGEPRVLVDPATFDPSGLTTVEWFSASPDGNLLAFGTYRSGDENTTLRLLDVNSNVTLPLEIPRKTQAAQWLPDSSGFVYQNLEDATDPYSARVRFHRLGTDPAGDPVLFRQFTREENEALATTWGPFAHLSTDGRWLVLGYWVDTKSTDVWLADFAEYLRTGRLERREISVGVQGVASGTVIGETLYLETTKRSPRGRVVVAPVAAPSEPHWRDLVPERSDAVIEATTFGRGAFALTYLRNASSVVEVFDLEGRSRGEILQPGLGSVGLAAEEDRTEAYLTFTSFNHPASIFRVDLERPQSASELWEQPSVPVDPSSIDVEQVWYPSKDGTLVSMFLVQRTGTARNGRVPTLLYGYGGFNISLTPAFSAPLIQWLDAGGLYAVPNLRGGGEYGDDWHSAGMLDRKQNVFDDFISAAEWLFREGYTCPDRLAIAGGSNGGLLTGAVLTQRPDLCRAAIVGVPLLDMLRYQHFLMARYWVPEYGSAENAAQFQTLVAYSPYHHVQQGTSYPAVLLTAGEHDTRVHALHARKMAAALQAATASAPSTHPVLLWVDRDAGHGQGKPLSLRLRDAVDQRTFLMWQLGMLTDRSTQRPSSLEAR
jgi:prolyl oligopeptidase